MSRNSTTGIYTRVSNSFSQPVTGTTIDPGDADSFFDDVESAVNAFIATSASSVAIGTGTKTFTVASDVAGKTFLAGTFVHIYSRADVADYMFGTVTSYSTSTGDLVVDVMATGGAGTNADWNISQAGARGAAGSVGATGREAGINYKWNASTSTGDPGTGKITISNSSTVLNISETDDDGNALASVIATWDDSTSTANRGKLYIMKTGGVGLKVFTIASAVTDGGTYDSFTGTVTTIGSFSDNDECFCYFIPTGDKGADGAGTGDFSSNTATSVDGEMLLFSGTGGKTGKRSTLTGGILKSTSGVPAIATAGTDYYNPGGTDVAVADGGTGSSTASGARTNLSAAALSQTSEFIAGYIKTPANQDYRLVVKIPHGGTITETVTRSESGTCTATFKVNTTALGGTANSVSSSEQAQAQASSNTFAADDDIVVTISSNSSCVGMSFTIKYTRTLL